MADTDAATSAPNVNTRGYFDKLRFAKHLRENAQSGSTGRCAEYVRKAMEAAGLNTGGRPGAAKDYGPFLVSAGFTELYKDQKTPDAPADYTAESGDIAVLGTTSDSKWGHIEGYDGTAWISDFVQRDMWAGYSWRHEPTTYAIYRFQAAAP
jgi:hypothetical protein